MLTFAFWNLGGRPLAEAVARLALENDVDVVALAESGLAPEVFLRHLNQGTDAGFRFPGPTNCPSIQIFVRFSTECVQPVVETDRYTIRQLSLPGKAVFLVAAVHMRSKLFQSEDSQIFDFMPLADDLRAAERDCGHTRSLLVGDLNANPFEPGLVAAFGLHGVMSRDVACREKRTVGSREYDFLYNPMWSLFGDGSPGPPGTFFYQRAEQVCYFWNMFDQVLLRPALCESFSNASLRIVTEVEGKSLLSKNGRPNPKVASDHLPILFGLEL